MLGLGAVCSGVLGGTLVGLISGYVSGAADAAIQRCVDVSLAFPQLLLLLIVVRLLGPSWMTIVLAIGAGLIPSVSRVVRSATLAEKSNLYIEAARSTGASEARILFRHLAPNVAPLGAIMGSTLLGSAILAEAALSFLGLGVPPPNPSWGADISQARVSFPINVWAALFPGAAITVTVLAFNLLGDALRDAMDPMASRG